MIHNITCNSDRPHVLINTDNLTLDLPNSGKTHLKKGFEWDGNSSPVGTWNLIPPFKYPLASAFHDLLCIKAKNNGERKKADKDYKWILKNIYKCKIRNHVGYFGVSIGRFIRRFTGYDKPDIFSKDVK